MLQGIQLPINPVKIAVAVIGFLGLVAGFVTGILQRALGILMADYLRPHIPWLSESDSSDSQDQEQSVEGSSESGDISAEAEQNQDNNAGQQDQNIDVDLGDGGEFSADQSQQQGDDASNHSDDSEDGDELVTDGGRAVEPSSETYPPLSLWGGLFGGDSSDDENSGSDSASAGASPTQQQNQTTDVDVTVNLDGSDNAISGEEGTHQLSFHYFPHSGRGDLPVDPRAFENDEFPIRGVDGEAQISITWVPEIPPHWILVCTPADFGVTLRDCRGAELDNTSDPPKFRPEDGARTVDIGVVVYTERDYVDHDLILRPADNAPCEPPDSGIYRSYRLVSGY